MKSLVIGLAMLGAGYAGWKWYQGSWGLDGDGLRIVVTEDEVREKLEKKFPYEKRILKVVPVEFRNPKVDILSGKERLRVSVDAVVTVPFVDEYQAGVTFSGKIRYESESKEFFLDDVRVEKVESELLPKKYAEGVGMVASLVADQWLQRQAVYELKDEKAKEKAARYLLKKVEAKDEKLVIWLGR